MNPLLAKLHPYPFERLRALNQGITPNPALTHIGLGIGEPKHATPEFIKQALADNLKGLASYPATAGEPALREAMTGWLARRYGVRVDPATQVLPVGGSREALFALAQTVIDPSRAGATVVCPNAIVIGTSPASRPRAITMRPMRWRLCRASQVYQRSPR